MNSNKKIIIYQLLPRLFTNRCNANIPNGSVSQNGAGKFNDITDKVLNSIKSLGVSHVWYTGIIEHATQTDYTRYGIKSSNPFIVKGKAGSPYAIRDYYDVDPDLAEDIPSRREEFRQLIARTHNNGLEVIIDFVPNHVAREYFPDNLSVAGKNFGEHDNTEVFFDPQNNFYYITGQLFNPSIDLGSGAQHYNEYPAKATGNDCFNASPSINDWYETVKLNYGINPSDSTQHFTPIPDTWNKMLDILLYWAALGVDGFRCDMAHMVPVEFWHWVIERVKKTFPHLIFIAEIYDVNLYRNYINYGGFDFLYDKVTLYDTLCDIMKGYRPASHLTDCWQTINGIRKHMLNFLENHDEQRLASPQNIGDTGKTIPAIVVSSTIYTSPFMLYAGQELGETGSGTQGYSGDDGRTSIFDYCSIPSIFRWYHQGECSTKNLSQEEKQLRRFYQRILKMCRQEKAISQGDFFDLMYVNYGNLNPQKHYVYLRHYKNVTLLIAVNFDGEPAHLDIDIPLHAFNYLQLKADTYTATDILNRQSHIVELSTREKIHVDIEPHNAVILKIVETSQY